MLTPLLPLRGFVATLRFLAPARPNFFHQPALHAFLRHLAGNPPEWDLYLTLDAPESGRLAYRAGDRYRFSVTGVAGGEGLLGRLLDGLMSLPGSAPVADPIVPFRGNLVLEELADLYGGGPVRRLLDLQPWGAAELEAEAALWRGASHPALAWLSPVRLLRDKAAREGLKGEARYCHDASQIDFSLLAARLHDGFADLLRRRGHTPPPRGPVPAADWKADLFWVEFAYKDSEGARHPMGGLLGRVELPAAAIAAADWPLWVLGRHLGGGQRRGFGWGRYRLEALGEGQTLATAPRPEPAATLLERACRGDNLAAAWSAIRANLPAAAHPKVDAEWGREAAAFADEEGDWDQDDGDRLSRLGQALAAGYVPPPLFGRIEHDADGGLRALAVPRFSDRVAQRAVAQVIGPGIESLLSEGSFGYRPGRSRHSARSQIEAAWKEGWRWVFEADIDDFFDSVAWDRLAVRLRGLFGDDPLVPLILAWMAAPVAWRGEVLPREAGLPQGAPLSPLLANLFLDDFDRDMEHAGFRLIRFADDFVVLARDRAEAEAAAEAARQSLAGIGLALHPDKSRVASFDQGFRYLGFLFAGGVTVDTAGEPRPAVLETTPPAASWLARLAARQPSPLPAGGLLPPRAIPSSAPEGAESGVIEDGEGATPAPHVAPLPDAGNFPSPRPSDAAPSLRHTGGEGRLLPATLSGAAEAGATLYLTGEPSLATTRQGRLVVERRGETVLEHPWNSLRALVLIGPQHITTPALQAALRHGVPVHFADSGGEYLGLAAAGHPGPLGPGLWLDQAARLADPQACLGAARNVVEARLRHQREVLRQRLPHPGLEEAIAAIDHALAALPGRGGLDALRGHEGEATAAYYQALATLVPAEYGFAGRNRRPPRDPFNALLSLGYSLLQAHVHTALLGDGLYPWLGFYHQPHGRHAVLASDLVEVFRHLVERTALNAVSRHGLGPERFHRTAAGACLLRHDARREYLRALSQRFETPVAGVHDPEPLPLTGALEAQNRRLVAWIRGESAEFLPWRAR